MDLVQTKHQGACSEDMSIKQSVSPDISGTLDEIRDAEVLPRVGDEYQAKIPPLVMNSNDFRLSKNQTARLDDVYIGLPVPIVWINDVQAIKQKKCNGSADLSLASNQKECSAVTEIQEFSEAQEIRPRDDATNSELATSSGDSTKFMFQREIGIKMKESNVDEGQLLVPDILNGSWSDIEVDSLLLGLYIFGKNLVLVKRFVETKSMGDILSFYYGKFYRSKKYRRWSACRKVRGKRCVCGPKLVTGWRQQELSSRLFSALSEENQKSLVEVSRRFTDGKIPLEVYVFSLKAIVGTKALVEAVGIGRGKQDLSAITMDPSLSNHVLPSRPEIPVGKACAMLTPVEIVKFLTGDFRLSKARSSDLFWEAVWPRLLAKGWHSEQANNYISAAGLKHSLVFLIPGVKKFCRRKLVKGDHYFDSVSDVLNKVASDPRLLELDTDADNELTAETKPDHVGFPSPQRFCYLKPRIPVHEMDIMKFMVVDTSLSRGKTAKFRELRTLPVEIMNTYASKSRSNDDDRMSSEVSMDDSSVDNSICCDVVDVLGVTISSDTKSSLQLDSCNGETSCNPIDLFTGPKQKQEYGSSSDHEDLSRNIPTRVDSSEENLHLTSLSRGSSVVEVPQERCQPHTLIDLNLPIPQDFDNFGSSTMEVKGGQKNIPNKCFDSLSIDKASESLDISERYSIKTSRRQSNRNRPLTTRALEAHALGLLDVKPKRKNRDIFL